MCNGELSCALVLCDKYFLSKTKRAILRSIELRNKKDYAGAVENCKRIYLALASEWGKERSVEILCAIGNPAWAYGFARCVEGLSSELNKKLAQVAIERKDTFWLGFFAAKILLSKELVNEIAAIIINENKPGPACNCAKFARGLERETVEKLAEVVINSGNAEWAYYFAEGVRGVSKETLQNLAFVVFSSREERWMLCFLDFVEGDWLSDKIKIQSADFNESILELAERFLLEVKKKGV